MTKEEQIKLRREMAEDPTVYFNSLVSKINIFGLKQHYHERLKFFFTKYPSFKETKMFRRSRGYNR